MNSIESSHADLLPVSLKILLVSAPDRMLSINGGFPHLLRSGRNSYSNCSTNRLNLAALTMSLSAGDRLGPYEIVAAIGAGGMGEVYRARDSRLRRDVAIKVLPSAFSGTATA